MIEESSFIIFRTPVTENELPNPKCVLHHMYIYTTKLDKQVMGMEQYELCLIANNSNKLYIFDFMYILTFGGAKVSV